LHLLEQALDSSQTGLQRHVLGLNPVDVGVQSLDLASRDTFASEIVERGAQGAGLLLRRAGRGSPAAARLASD
jgi:hypothetical protein